MLSTNKTKQHGNYETSQKLGDFRKQSEYIQVLLLDQRGFLSKDIEPMMPKGLFHLTSVTSGLKAVESIAGLEHNNQYPNYDIVIVPHEIDDGSGVSVCRTLRRFYNSEELIILAFVPPFLTETQLLAYVASEVDEICTYPLSRLTLQQKFKMFASLVQAHRRNILLCKIQSLIPKLLLEENPYNEISRLLQNDFHICNVSIRTSENNSSLYKSNKYNGKRYYSSENKIQIKVPQQKNMALFIDFISEPDEQDISFVMSCLSLLNMKKKEILDIKTVDGLSLLHTQLKAICAIKGANQYSEVIFKSGTTKLISNTPLKTIANHFRSHFTQCHRSWLVSNQLDWKCYHRGKGRYNISFAKIHVPLGDRFIMNLKLNMPHWFS